MQVHNPLITLFLPSLEGGGAERVFVQLANKFVALGYRVHLVLVRGRGPYLEEVSADIKVVDFGASGVLRSLPKLVRYLRSSRPTVMLSGLDHANIVALLARVLARTDTRSVISMRSVPTAVYRQNKTIWRWALLRLMCLIYPLADMIVANSRAVASDLAGLLRVPEQKLSVIYNPLDLASIDNQSGASNDHEWLVTGARPVVVTIGSLNALKDFPTLIRAFALAQEKQNCRLAILGEGSDRARLEKLAEELGVDDCVSFLGFVTNPFTWLKKAAVFVSSSVTEGCPNALMQALACGTPVVSTDCAGGSGEILQAGKWGALVPVGDAQAMSAAILAVIDAPQRLDVRQRAEDFAIAGIASEYLQILLPQDSILQS